MLSEQLTLAAVALPRQNFHYALHCQELLRKVVQQRNHSEGADGGIERRSLELFFCAVAAFDTARYFAHESLWEGASSAHGRGNEKS